MTEVVFGPPWDAGNGIGTAAPNWARVWNRWLGGRDNYPADRRYGDDIARIMPGIRRQAQVHRYWVCRIVRFLAEQQGIGQFLQVGAGLPMGEDDPHRIARRARTDARFVYADDDPLVLAHAHALMADGPAGMCAVVDSALGDVRTILAGSAEHLDLQAPVGILLPGVLHRLPDGEAHRLAAGLAAAAVPGSCVAIAHPTATAAPMAMRYAARRFEDADGGTFAVRGPKEVAEFFGDLEMFEPGLATCEDWRPELCDEQAPVDQLGGVARKR